MVKQAHKTCLHGHSNSQAGQSQNAERYPSSRENTTSYKMVPCTWAVKLWMGSPEHRAIILTPGFREIGIAAVHAASAPGAFGDDEVTVVTADFGQRAAT